MHPGVVYNLQAQAISENRGPADNAMHMRAVNASLLYSFSLSIHRPIFHLSALNQPLQIGLPGSVQHCGSA